MDNASKALIMAGAILISVAIVGIGIYIFSAANSMTNDAVNSMDSVQVQIFNNNFYRYANDSDKILGSRVKELIRFANSQGVTCDKKESDITNSFKYTITYTTTDGVITGVGIAGNNDGQ